MATEKDQKIHRVVDIYQGFIVEFIRPSELLFYSPTLQEALGDDAVLEIKKTERCKGNKYAAKIFLEKMNSCQSPGVWTAFIDVLKNEAVGYTRVSNLLERRQVKDDKYERALLKVLGPAVADKIDPIALSPWLRSNGCLKDQDCEEIRREADNNGNIVATMLLFDKLPKRNEDWYSLFMKTLLENEQFGLMNELDPDFLEREKLPDSTVSDGGSYVSSTSTSMRDDDQTKEKLMVCEEPMEHEEYHDASNDLDKNYSAPTCTDGERRAEINVEDNVRKSMDALETNRDDGTSKQLGQLDKNISPPQMGQEKSNPDHANLHDGTSDGEESMEEEEDTRRDLLKLRNYQQELAHAGLKGKNCIIVAPTGSGKTHVALKIIQEHFNSPGPGEIRKVLFLINNVALATQQAEACKKFLPAWNTTLLSGDNQAKVPLKYSLQGSDIMVMTAQILVDGLRDGEIPDQSVSTFTLMVFDECHHTHKSHPYNIIMNFYLDEKLSENGPSRRLPQVKLLEDGLSRRFPQV